jgi:hypothetical protein
MPFMTSLLSWLMVKRLNEIELFRQYPSDVQLETLMELLKTAKDTEFGKLYDFESIRSDEEFRRRVPVRTYEGIEPFIDKVRKGEKNILWPGEIKWMAKSSGTTNDKSKFIPISKESLEYCHFRGGKDVLAIYASHFPKSGIFKGKALVIGGSQQINNYNNELYYGDLSAVLIQNLPFWVNFIRTPDISIALMDDWEQKIEKMANATMIENVTNISGVPSWTLVLIKYILEKTGKSNVLDIWPSLELFVHGGVSFTPYREQYKKLIPSDKMNYMETYNASEGFFGIQDDPAKDDMLLMLDYGMFYEFVPVENAMDENPEAISLDAVEIGKNYALVISTNCGLWRYMIGDTVKFTSKSPYKIKITGRVKHFINAFGEELIIDNAERALKQACERTGAAIREYSAAPVYMEAGKKGGHQWLIEFEQLPDDLDHFTSLLDNNLKTLNSDYEAKRYKNLSLNRPEVIVARKGLFYDWLKERGKLGGQHKVPRLANNREYIEPLLEMNRK